MTSMMGLGEMLPQLGFGGVAGAAVGYTAKKATKLAALLLGTTFMVLQLLRYYGFIEVSWDRVEQVATPVLTDGSAIDAAQRILLANLPFTGAFAAGFAVGFKAG